MPEQTEVAEATTSGDPIVDRLTKSFAALENPTQVDNSSKPEAKPDETEKVEAPEEPAKAEEPEKAEPEKEVEKPESESEEDGEEETLLTYPESVDELKAGWPRAVPLKVIDQAYQWSVEAKEGKEAIASLGGEHYLPPLAKMAGALQVTDAPPEAFQPFFEGVVEAAGDDALRKVLAQSVYIAFVQGPEWQANKATKDFGDELHTMVDAAVQTRFGVNAETIANLADWQSIGAFDEFSKWIEDEFKDDDGDYDKFKFLEASEKLYNDIRAIQHNPKLKAQTKENLELKRQLEERKAEVKPPVSDIENSFSEYIDTVISTVLPKVIFAKSPLAELDTDTAEMKERKADFRDSLTAKLRSALNGERKQLLEGFRQGKQNTAVYQTQLGNALEAAIGKIEHSRKIAEKTIADLYGNTRNGRLLKKAEELKQDNTEAPLTPTQPANLAPKNGPKTEKEILQNLTNSFAAHDANRR